MLFVFMPGLGLLTHSLFAFKYDLALCTVLLMLVFANSMFNCFVCAFLTSIKGLCALRRNSIITIIT